MKAIVTLTEQEVKNLVLNYLVDKGFNPVLGSESPILTPDSYGETFTFDGFTVNLEEPAYRTTR